MNEKHKKLPDNPLAFLIRNKLVKLTPSYHGKDCLANGEHAGYECACDECDHYLECFPDWREMMNQE